MALNTPSVVCLGPHRPTRNTQGGLHRNTVVFTKKKSRECNNFGLIKRGQTKLNTGNSSINWSNKPKHEGKLVQWSIGSLRKQGGENKQTESTKIS